MTENPNIGKQNDDGLNVIHFWQHSTIKCPQFSLPFQLLDLTIPSCSELKAIISRNRLTNTTAFSVVTE